MADAFLSALMPVIMLGVVAIAVFEAGKASHRAASELCICGHRQTYMFSPARGHVQRRDWDSNAWIPGAEHAPGKCRECKCRAFHPAPDVR